MSGEFQLNAEQKSKLQEITNNGEGNYAAGYDYLRQQIQTFLDAPENASHPDQQAYENTNYWLEKAAEINRNDPNSDANAYIREVTRSGLLFDGKNADPAKIQENSDIIGKTVMADISDKSFIPSIDALLQRDVQSALGVGGQTLAGWGGSFYYWDMQMSDKPNDTVGNRIIGDPAEYEKFLAVSTKAAIETMARLGISFEQFETARKAQVPEKVMSEIMDRSAFVLDDGDGQSDYMGSPNEVDGYRASIGSDDVVSWYQLDKNLQRVRLQDEAMISKLNTRRNLRLEKGLNHPWQAPKTEARVDKITLNDGTIYEQTYGADGSVKQTAKTSPDGTRIEKGYDPVNSKVIYEKRFDKDGNLTFDSVEDARKQVEVEKNATEKAAAAKAEADRIAAEQAVAAKAKADKAAEDKLRADKAAQASAIELINKQAEENRLAFEKKQDEVRKQAVEFNKKQEEMFSSIHDSLDKITKNPVGNSDYSKFQPVQVSDSTLTPPRVDIPIFTPSFTPINSSSYSGGIPGINIGLLNPPVPGIKPFSPLDIGVPVVLDLNRDGNLDIEPLTGNRDQALQSFEQMQDVVDNIVNTVSFDWNGDRVPDQTAWVGPGDGVLVIDLANNGYTGGDGVIDQPKEIAFALWKTEEERGAELKEKGIDDTGRPVTDLEGLRWAFDSNHDNVLDMRDARWNEFRVWQDANQNGVTDPGELLTMDQAGIRLIDLMPSSDGNKVFPDGSAITGTSSAEMTDGTKMLVGDVSLAYRPSLAG